MRQPGNNLCHAALDGAARQLGSVDHNDWQAEAARGRELGHGTDAAGVLGHHLGNAMALHQRGITGRIKGPASDLHRRVRQRQGRIRLVHQTQQIVVLGLGRKLAEVLLSDCQKHPRGHLRQRIHRAVDAVHMDPIVALARLPGRTFKGAEWHTRRHTGLDRIGTHLRGEGVGCVDHMGDGFGREVSRQAFGAAKTANTRGQRLADRLGGATRIRKHRIRACPGQGLGQRRGFGGAAQKKDACHV